MYSSSKKKGRKKERKTPIYFNTNCRTEMDCCLLQFDALKFFLGMRLHGGSYQTLIFSV